MGRKGKGVNQNDFANALIAHNNAITMANGYSRGYGLKEDWNNSRLGKNINNFVKKHKKVIDAVRNDESVQNLYHSKHIAPYHGDIDSIVSHFGNGLGTGLYAGTGIHHHHHYHIAGGGMWDWADPNKNGFSRAMDPNQNGLADSARKTFSPALGNQIVGGLKTVGHYAIPQITGALGGLGGEFLSGGNPLAGFAGNQAGKLAGQQINKSIGIGIPKRGRGRPRKICE